MTEQEQARLRALVATARAATATLRDAARTGTIIEFRQRDPLVLAIFDALRELDALLSAPVVSQPCVIGEYCHRHQFEHGAEAEEFRSRLEMLEDQPWAQRLLDEVDARDSAAYVARTTAAPVVTQEGE